MISKAVPRGDACTFKLLITCIENGPEQILDIWPHGRYDTRTGTALLHDRGNALHEAARHNRATIAAILIDVVPHIDVNVTNGVGATPLIEAAKGGHTSVAKVLLRHPGIDVNVASGDESGETALHRAVRGKGARCAEFVALLLQAPHIDVNATCQDGITPFHQALFERHTFELKYLLKAKPSIIEMLIDMPNFDVNASNIAFGTALHFAACYGYTDVAEMLLALPNIDVNVVNGHGATPLHNAALYGKVGVAKALLAASADIDLTIEDHSGRTPLRAAEVGGDQSIVKLLRAQRGGGFFTRLLK